MNRPERSADATLDLMLTEVDRGVLNGHRPVLIPVLVLVLVLVVRSADHRHRHSHGQRQSAHKDRPMLHTDLRFELTVERADACTELRCACLDIERRNTTAGC